MKIETIKTSKKKIRVIDNEGAMALAIYDPETEAHTIAIPYKVSTKTRLHEIAHCVLGHCLARNNRVSVNEYITQEIEAEEWACQKCNKPLSLEAVLNIAHQVIVWGIHSNTTFSTSLRVLARYDYNLTREQRSYLWNSCLEMGKERKEKR